MGVGILGVEIVGIDILGVDILGRHPRDNERSLARCSFFAIDG